MFQNGETLTIVVNAELLSLCEAGNYFKTPERQTRHPNLSYWMRVYPNGNSITNKGFVGISIFTSVGGCEAEYSITIDETDIAEKDKIHFHDQPKSCYYQNLVTHDNLRIREIIKNNEFTIRCKLHFRMVSRTIQEKFPNMPHMDIIKLNQNELETFEPGYSIVTDKQPACEITWNNVCYPCGYQDDDNGYISVVSNVEGDPVTLEISYALSVGGVLVYNTFHQRFDKIINKISSTKLYSHALCQRADQTNGVIELKCILIFDQRPQSNLPITPPPDYHETISNIDQIFESIGYGRYQIYQFFAFQLLSISRIIGFTASFRALGGLIPEYECNDKSNPWSYSSAEVSQQSDLVCNRIQNCTNLVTKSQWHSMYEEFRLVCGYDYEFQMLAILFQFILTIVTHLVSGHVADRLGRKWIIVFGQAYSVVIGIGYAWSPNFKNYLFFTLMATSIVPISASAALSLLVESVSPRYRLVQLSALDLSLGYMVAGLLAPLVGCWRVQFLASCFIGVLAFFMLLKTEESPRFLLQEQRYSEAAAALTRIAKVNGKQVAFTEDEMRRIYDASVYAKTKKVRHYTAFALFSNPKLAMYAISQIVTGIAINAIHILFIRKVNNWFKNPFMNVVASGALTVWAPLIAYKLENSQIGRRKLFLLLQGIVCLLLALMFIIKVTFLDGTARIFDTMVVFVFILEWGFVSIVYNLYTVELFPTCMRSIALSTLGSISFLGGSAIPILTAFLKFYWHPAPYVFVILITSLSFGFAAKFFPETQFVALPDTRKQAIARQNMYRERLLTSESEDISEEDELLSKI